MKAARRTALLAVALVLPAFARLGDSPDAAVKRYGPGTAATFEAPATQGLTFSHGGYEIVAEFFDGRCHRIGYRKPKSAPFSEGEIKGLLKDNGGTWTPADPRLNPVAEKLGVKRWARGDRGFAVRGTNDDGTHALVLTDGAWMARKLRAAAGQPAAVTPAPASDASWLHTLDWTGYDGAGDTAAARLVFDGRDLGTGETALAALQKMIAALPSKSTVKLARYYGDSADGAAPPKKYPFDVAALRAHAEQHGVTLLIPQPK